MSKSRRRRRRSSQAAAPVALGVLLGALLGAVVGVVEATRHVRAPATTHSDGYAVPPEDTEEHDPLVVGPLLGLVGGALVGAGIGGLCHTLRRLRGPSC